MTNDDLVKDSKLIEDYEIEISFEGMRDGADVWEFTLTPREEAAVIWGSIVEEVRKDDDAVPTLADDADPTVDPAIQTTIDALTVDVEKLGLPKAASDQP